LTVISLLVPNPIQPPYRSAAHPPRHLLTGERRPRSEATVPVQVGSQVRPAVSYPVLGQAHERLGVFADKIDGAE
jgi:hypothetical protein